MAGSEVFGHLLRVEFGADGDEKVAEPARGGQRGGVVAESVVFHQADQQAAVAPQQGEIVVAGMFRIEALAEVAFRMLQREGFLYEFVEYGEVVAKGSRRSGERADPAARQVAAEIGEAPARLAAQVVEQGIGV